MKSLFLITARGGSKGIPHKNIKPLNGKPLICYAIDLARQFVDDEDICVSTDGDDIIEIVEGYGLKVPFKRPDELASDTAGSYEVILHAVKFYESHGRHYDNVVLLQPTSPFRTKEDVVGCINKFDGACDMVVSVKPASANPYYDIFEENEFGHLVISKGDGKITRRQDAPKCYEYNGAVYVININSLNTQHMNDFQKIRFYEMSEIHSVDLDTMLDWKYAELLINEGLV
jgi:N-acylneuraminate cytidylyltransferase